MELLSGKDQEPTIVRKPKVYVSGGESISKRQNFFTIYISYIIVNLCYHILFSSRNQIELIAHVLHQMIIKL